MKQPAVFILAGIVAAAVLFGGGYFMHKCPKPLKPIPTAQIPETKPAKTKESLPPKPVIKWRDMPVVDVTRLSEAEKKSYALGHQDGWKEGWDSCAQAHFAYSKPERFTVTDTVPHTRDSITFWSLADTFSVIHMGIIPTVLAGGNGEGGKKSRSLLHFGLTAWFGQPAEFWGTIPLPREKRMFYMPQRGGLNYQPKGKEVKLTLEWEVL